jgi:hypothetical protein
MGYSGLAKRPDRSLEHFPSLTSSKDAKHCMRASLRQDQGITHLAIPGALAIDDKFMLRVVVIPIARSTVTDLFTLILNLAYARLASAANIVGDLHEPKNVLLQTVSCYQKECKG